MEALTAVSPPVEPVNKAKQYAAEAMTSLAKHNIPPTPEAYSVWYAAASGAHNLLISEIAEMDRLAIAHTAVTTLRLYKKYIAVDTLSDEAAAAAQNTNKLLAGVIGMMTGFTDETKGFSKDIDGYMGKLGSVDGGTDIKALVDELKQASASMKGRSDSLNKKLEESQKEIEGLKKSLTQITEESQRDFLTGVNNRKTFDAMLAEHMAQARANKTDLSLLMLDIDHFKTFNDKFGHLIGDEVLKVVAKTLTDCVRGKDVVARYGGEEFAVILPETPLIGAQKVAETIRATVAKRELKRRDKNETYGAITVSVGIGLFRPDSDAGSAIIKRADEALYTSKRRGRNRVTVEGEGLD